jgi:hypothetical protein
MSWRGLAGPARPAKQRSLATGRLHRTAPRLAGLDCSWPVCRGTVVPKCPGPDRSGPGPPWTVPRGLTRPIARSRVLRWTCPPRSHPADRSVARPSTNCPAWGPGPDCSGPGPARNGCPTWPSGTDRSAPAPVRSGCPADSAPITRGPPARDCPASLHPDCSGHTVAGRALLVDRRLLARPRLGTHHRSREPVSDRGLPRPATFRKSPSGPVPVPGDIASCSGRGDSPTRAWGPRIRRVLASTGRSTGQPRVVPRSPRVVHRFIHRIIHITPDPCPACGQSETGFSRRRTGSAGSRGRNTFRGRPGSAP